MHANELKRHLDAKPFEPFVIHMTDGRTFYVRHPELLHVFPGMERRAVLGIPGEQAVEVLDLFHVASLTIADNGETQD